MSEMVINSFVLNDLLAKMLAWWPMDESSGTRVDVHGGFDLTEQGTVASVTGVVNDAAEFPGDGSGYLDLLDAGNPEFDFQDTSFTFAGWVRRNSGESGNKGLVTKWNFAGSASYAFFWIGASLIRWTVKGAVETSVVEALDPISDDTFTHFNVYYDHVAKEIGIIIDDGTPVTTSHTDGIGDISVPFTAGAREGGGSNMNGAIDELSAYTGLLTAAENTLLASGIGYPG